MSSYALMLTADTIKAGFFDIETKGFVGELIVPVESYGLLPLVGDRVTLQTQKTERATMRVVERLWHFSPALNVVVMFYDVEVLAKSQTDVRDDGRHTP